MKKKINIDKDAKEVKVDVTDIADGIKKAKAKALERKIRYEVSLIYRKHKKIKNQRKKNRANKRSGRINNKKR